MNTLRDMLESKGWLDDVLSNLVEYSAVREEWNSEKSKYIDVIPQNIATLLGYKFDNGYGGTEGYSILIYTKDWVYFMVCYDGAEWVERIPRNPQKEFRPEHYGGG